MNLEDFDAFAIRLTFVLGLLIGIVVGLILGAL